VSVLKYNISAIIISLLLAACGSNAPDCMKSTGKVIRETRSLNTFSTLEISGNINVILTSDSSYDVVVEAGEHLLKKIKTEVSGTRLLVRNDNSCNWVRSYKNPLNVYVGIKNIDDIFQYSPELLSTEKLLIKDTLIVHLYSNGSVNLDLDSKSIWLDMDFLGDCRLRGKTKKMLVTSLGMGQFNSEGMNCAELYVFGKGQGDVFVRSDSSLVAYIENSGNVYYSGSPVVIGGSNTGTGRLIQK
jgi:hypothetical protein